MDLDLARIDIGRAPNDGTGDDLRTAGAKSNANFALLADAVADGRATAQAALEIASDRGAIQTQAVALVDIPGSTAVVDAGNGTCTVADPGNMAHRGRFLGVVVSPTSAGSKATVYGAGAVPGLVGAFLPSDALFIGDGLSGRRLGSIVNVPAATRTSGSVWRQQIGTAVGVGVGIGALLLPGIAYEVPASTAAPVIALPPGAVRRSQLLRAASAGLPGGLKSFLASGLVSPDPDDASNVAYFHEPFATPTGALAGLLSAYLVLPSGSGGLGLSAVQARALIMALFAAAALQLVGT